MRRWWTASKGSAKSTGQIAMRSNKPPCCCLCASRFRVMTTDPFIHGGAE